MRPFLRSAALMLGLAWVAGACAAPVFVHAGSSLGNVFEIDAATLRRDRGQVRYRLRTYSTGDYYVGADVYDITVDCDQRTREETSRVMITRSRVVGGHGVASSARRVYDGSRQAEELELACRLVDHPSDAPLPVPTSAVDAAPGLKPARWAVGVLVSDDGLVLTSDRAVRGCRAVRVANARQLLPAEVLNRGPLAGMAVLRIPGAGFTGLAPAERRPDEGVFALGFDGNGTQDPAPRVASARVNENGDLSIDPGSRMAEAVVVDAAAGVAGFVLPDPGRADESLDGDVLSPAALRAVLQFAGHDWVPVPGAPPGPSEATLRRTIAGLARVDCLNAD